MQVTNVRISFFREKQPAKFEKAHPAVEYAAVLDEGENHELVARELMISATRVVYNGLGYAVPVKVAEALAEGVTPAELSVATETAETATEASGGAGEAPETEEDKPKTRGRPKGSKNTAPKKETAAAERKRKAAEAEAAAAPDEAPHSSSSFPAHHAAEVPGKDDGVPGDDEPTPNISTGEERVNPDDEVPGSEENGDPADYTSEEFTPKDLHTLIMSHVNATPRTLSVANAKQILAHFKVARAQDLTNKQAIEGKGLVEKMVAAAAEKG